LNLELDRLMG